MEFIFKVGQIDSLVIYEALSDYIHDKTKHKDDRKAAEKVLRKLTDEVKRQWLEKENM